MRCSVVEARAWTHRGRLGCIAFLRGENSDADAADDRTARILARLGHLLRGDAGAVAAVPAVAVAHADRRLHQPMAADLDQDHGRAFPTPAVSIESWAERGYSVVTVQCRDRPKLLLDFSCFILDFYSICIDLLVLDLFPSPSLFLVAAAVLLEEVVAAAERGPAAEGRPRKGAMSVGGWGDGTHSPR